MRGKHEESLHMQPMQRENVAITCREYRLTLNVMRRESRGTNKLTLQKRLDFPYSYARPNKGQQRNKGGN